MNRITGRLSKQQVQRSGSCVPQIVFLRTASRIGSCAKSSADLRPGRLQLDCMHDCLNATDQVLWCPVGMHEMHYETVSAGCWNRSAASEAACVTRSLRRRLRTSRVHDVLQWFDGGPRQAAGWDWAAVVQLEGGYRLGCDFLVDKPSLICRKRHSW